MSRIDRYEYKDWKNFGKRIKTYREQIGMSNEKFSEMINRSENYAMELQKGNTSCSVHTLHQISKALKVSTDLLLYGKTDTKEYYSDRDILHSIIDRCNEKELKVLKEINVAIFPNLQEITK